MSPENVELVRRMYDAFDRGDLTTVFAFIAPDAVIDASHRVDGRVGRGHQELVAIVSEWFTTWDEWTQEVEEIRDLGERVLVIETQRGRGRGSGAEWSGRFGMLYEIRDGLMTRWTIYDDLAEAFEAAGVA